MHFEGSLSGPSRGQYLVQVGGVSENANLDQIMTPQIFVRNFFFKKRVESPIFIVLFDKGFYTKTNLHIYIYVYVYVYIYTYVQGGFRAK